MRAAICYELGKPLVVEDGVTCDSPGKGEVKVRVAATAVCRSDLHAIEGLFPGHVPGVAGHETAGYVEEVGEGVTRVKKGDAVCVIAGTVGCGMCPSCLAGQRMMCMNRGRPVPHQHTRDGKDLTPFAGPVAGWAEYTTVAEYQLVKIPQDFPIDRAALVSCCVITGFGSVLTAGVKLFSSVAVLGTGAVGLNAIQGAAYCGAHPVIAVDTQENRLKAARTFGATKTINPKKVDDIIKAVREATDGNGADYVFVTVTTSSDEILRQAVEMSSRRGLIIRIAVGGRMGPPAPGAPPPDIEWSRGLTAMGSSRSVIFTMMGSSNIIVDIPRYISLYKAGRLKLDELITARYPLAQINEAIEQMGSGKALRTVVMMP
jgi:S-(hydroxymethyl)glutathione dehydrogenase/alcohol dehydrogenase